MKRVGISPARLSIVRAGVVRLPLILGALGVLLEATQTAANIERVEPLLRVIGVRGRARVADERRLEIVFVLGTRLPVGITKRSAGVVAFFVHFEATLREGKREGRKVSE